MEYIERMLKIELPKRQSAFLWGPRQTGKSTYLKHKFPESIIYDFLKSDVFFEFSKNPSLLRQQLLSMKEEKLRNPIILDEVQKVPQILDEVHWLIENRSLQFILCGSSARKLRKGNVNLLGGRAWRYQMHPLTFAEIKDFDLIRALNHGLIPKHYLSSNHKKSLQAFVQDYMKEEVFAEGLTRNIPAFSRFFDAMAYSHGELTNYMNIARDCGVNSKTVKEYYQILVDTLLGIMVEPFKRRQHRQVISKASKFYLFDVGIANYLAHRNITEPKGEQFGRAFEHFILMELIAYRSYHELDYKIEFWRTKSGLEVDFVLNKGEVAIEVKGKRGISGSDLHGLRAFIEEYSPRRAYLICCEGARRVMDRIIIIPWEEFLDELWGGKIGVKAGK